ncbi:MAG: ROK family protein [Acidimicrobiia bacterium]|nr:ROK family protein [Acidimicrobiia bacterium]MBT8215969.1 ROK family protein [Acidimicrobiia bacterium]NNF08930.1 ROK family protein [Acidimicrobiia bacterium]NNL70922.1 ROK family protein [Acidimicrobiia bacterium]
MAQQEIQPGAHVLGIDVGGSGIKGGIVDLDAGRLLTDRHRIATPQPATPKAVAKTVRKLVEHFTWDGAVGVAIPSIIRHGIVHSAANIDPSWIGDDAVARFSGVLDRTVWVLNDADAAGLAELHFGHARDYADGVVILLTFGTGIGSAIFVEGELLPNSELGHLELNGDDAEHWASAKVRERDNLSWEEWAGRVNTYLQHVEFLFSPDLFIIGGGVSRRSEKFFPYLETSARIIAADLENRAGVVGAAWYAAQKGEI